MRTDSHATTNMLSIDALPNLLKYGAPLASHRCVRDPLQQRQGLKEHYHVFAHAQEFDFRTGGQEIKDAGIDIELSQIRLHRPQSTLALP